MDARTKASSCTIIHVETSLTAIGQNYCIACTSARNLEFLQSIHRAVVIIISQKRATFLAKFVVSQIDVFVFFSS